MHELLGIRWFLAKIIEFECVKHVTNPIRNHHTDI